MNQTTSTTSDTNTELYDIATAAKILGLKRDTLRWYLRRQHRVVPQRQGKQKMVLTAADLLRLWDEIAVIRGY
jgi:DNA-binding transcriptional MerR regulator